MITDLKINGTSINIAGTRMLTSITGATGPSIELESYSRGSGDGVVLGRSNYRGLIISFSVAIMTASASSLITEKQRLIKLLTIDPNSNNDQKTFTFVLANGTELSSTGIVSKISHNLQTGDVGYAEVLVQLQTERSYLQGADKTATLQVVNLGGMSIPMSVPMAMNLGSQQETLTQLTNNGTAYGSIAVSVTGPTVGLALINQTRGTRWQTSATLTATDTLAIDFYERTAIVNNSTNILATVSGNWWSLAPGVNEVFLAANNYDNQTSATIVYQDTYLGI